jgi:hypothetical protein
LREGNTKGSIVISYALRTLGCGHGAPRGRKGRGGISRSDDAGHDDGGERGAWAGHVHPEFTPLTVRA